MWNPRIPCLTLACIVCATNAFSTAEEATSPQVASPLTAEASLEHFELLPGLKLELVAAEPEVIDPIEIRFDERGRMWVVEMRDYPVGPVAGGEPQSRIRVLEDRDQDGRYESATTFVEGLVFPTGLQHWRGGIFVTLAGEIAYFPDKDGDLKADGRETWYTGFTQENQQLRANHPRLSADGWIYVAGGLRGGKILNARNADEEPIDIRGRDFRFDPQTGKAEAIAGNSQFGMCLDPFGNRFVVDNRHPMRQVVIEDHLLQRAPRLAFPALVHDVMKGGEESVVHPIAPAWTTSNLHAGQFTASCSPLLCSGRFLGKGHPQLALVCEPTGSLVHGESVKFHGGVFEAAPLDEHQEFLASFDPWFRPVNLEIGPEGNIYVVDMYRAVIEHPQWMPEELKSRRDLRDGDDRGRIYRISSLTTSATKSAKAPSEVTRSTLYGNLQSGNPWQHQTAARLVLEQQREDAQPPTWLLGPFYKSPSTDEGRATALTLLNTLGILEDEVLLDAIDDLCPEVRHVACRLAAPKLATSDKLRSAVVDACRQGDHEGLSAVLALAGSENENEVLAALAIRAIRDADKVWMRRAVLAASATRSADLLVGVLGMSGSPADSPTQEESLRALADELGRHVGAQLDRQGTANLLAFAKTSITLGEPSMLVAAALAGIGEGVAQRGKRLSDWLAEGEADEAARKAALDAAQRWFEFAAELAMNQQALPADRRLAVDLLAHATSSVAVEPLLALAGETAQTSLQAEALTALRRHDDDRLAPAILAAYSQQPPAVRRAMLDLLIASNSGAMALVDAIETKRLAAGELDTVRRQALVRHRDATVKKRAAALFEAKPDEDRQKVFQQYAAVLTTGEAQRGRTVFQKNCATCHRIGGEGFSVGPDISDSRTKKPEQLLLDVLEPSRAIDAAFTTYIALGTDGQMVTGVVTSESANSITLQQPEGKSATLLREEIDELHVSEVSLMPAGIERSIPPREMADLISYIKNWRYLDGSIPLSR